MRNPQQVLTPADCDRLIAYSEASLTPAQVGVPGNRRVHESRKCDSVKLHLDCDQSSMIKRWAVMSYSTELLERGADARGHRWSAEAVEIVRYQTGGLFLPHRDGNDRLRSAVVWLNDLHEYDGGHLHFPEHRLRIKGHKGIGVMWDNQDPDNIHEGLPVFSGIKWIALLWLGHRRRVRTQ